MRFVKIMSIFFCAAFLFAGCGVITDMASDNEWHFGYFGKVDYISPVKLRVGVVPFSDEVGLGASNVGANLADLMANEMSRDKNLQVVSVEEVQAALRARGFYPPLTPQQAALIGNDLRLNAVILGSVSEIKKYNIRKGWRRIASFVTSQREYIDAVLAVSAVDTQTGIVLVSRANVGEYDAGSGNKDFLEAGEASKRRPDQEGIEASLDEALSEAYWRTKQGLAALPFKAKALSVYNGQVTIDAGSELGLKKGHQFVKLVVENVITNTIGESYQIMGAPVAKLQIIDLTKTAAILEITEGSLYPGDIIQMIAK